MVVHARKSLAGKRYLKQVVRGFDAVLPRPVFNAFYAVAFPTYKALIRASFWTYGLLSVSWRDRVRWRMQRDIVHVMPRSLVGIGGLEISHWSVRHANDLSIPGDIVELGVARGGCAALLARVLLRDSRPVAAARKVWLFDSFEGLPEPGPEDFRADDPNAGTGDHVRPLPKGSCLGTLEDVSEYLLDQEHVPSDRVRFVKGWFQDTVPVTGPDIGPIAVLRIDGDWYESTKTCLEGLYDQVSPQGVIIIDDYQSCYGAERAVDEFIANRRLTVAIQLDGRGGCYFLKPDSRPQPAPALTG